MRLTDYCSRVFPYVVNITTIYPKTLAKDRNSVV